MRVMSILRSVCVRVLVGLFFYSTCDLYYFVPDTSPCRFIILFRKGGHTKGAVFTRACSHTLETWCLSDHDLYKHHVMYHVSNDLAEDQGEYLCTFRV